jgi:hypothetical protein
MKTIPAGTGAGAHPLLTSADLKDLGKGACAYVRKYEVNGQEAFVLYAADGAAICVQRTARGALEAAREQSLSLISVH